MLFDEDEKFNRTTYRFRELVSIYRFNLSSTVDAIIFVVLVANSRQMHN
jgi:hypothetical protein